MNWFVALVMMEMMMETKLFYKIDKTERVVMSKRKKNIEDEKEYDDFRSGLTYLIRKSLDQQGKPELTMGEDALDDILHKVDEDVSDLFRRGNLVRKVGGGEKEVTAEHLKIAKYSNELLHNEYKTTTTAEAGDESKKELIDILMAEDDAEVEDGRDDGIKKAISRKNAIELERRKYRYQLLIHHRKKVAENAREIRSVRTKKVDGRGGEGGK